MTGDQDPDDGFLADQNSSGQIQWVQLPWEVEKRMEDMYLDLTKGVDDYVV